MLKRTNLKLVIQSAATALVVVLSTMSAVGATTTIGANISTDGSLTVATTSTLQGAASITSTSNPQLTVKYDTANYMTQGVSSTGVVTFSRLGSALQKGFTLADTVAVATSSAQTLLTVDSTSTGTASTTLAVYQGGTGNAAIFMGGRVGVASSTPWGLLAVEQSTETYSFVVGNQGSTTPSFIINGVNGNGRVGVGTSSPSALFSIGAEANGLSTSTPMVMLGFNNITWAGTTTIDLGRPCFRSKTDGGTTIYWWWSLQGTSPIIASSTTSCF